MSHHIDTFPWRIIIKHSGSARPKLVIQNELNNTYITNQAIVKRIEALIQKSGRSYVPISYGVMLSTGTDEYYLGIVMNQLFRPLPIVVDNFLVAQQTVQPNVHVVVAFLGKEIECVISNDNLQNCDDIYAITHAIRFSLRERLVPYVTKAS